MISFPVPQLPAPDSDRLDMTLAFQARDVLSFLAGRLPTRTELEAIQSEKGLEFATTVLHRAILQNEPHAGFSRHIHGLVPQPLRREAGEDSIEVVFVPSVSWNVGMKWGQHCEWMRKVARDMGFATDVIDTSARESITGNARAIDEYLKDATASRIILVSVGRGAAEIRLLLQKRAKDSVELRKIRGWINIGGSFNGSRLVAEALANRPTRLAAEAEFWILRRKIAALRELASDSGLWHNRLSMHARMMIVSVFGLLTTKAQAPIGHRADFELLSRLGPNDGATLAWEAMARPGLLYPVPGLTYQAEEISLLPLFQRLLTCMGYAIQKADRSQRPDLADPHLGDLSI